MLAGAAETWQVEENNLQVRTLEAVSAFRLKKIHRRMIIDNKWDKRYQEEKIWLQRYMPLRDLKYWFKNKKSRLCFTRIDQFNDTLEGWENKYPELNHAWQEFQGYSKRVLDDGGIVESGNCVISRLTQLQNISKFRGQEGINQINQEIRNYINTIESNYASCWFMTKNPFEEKRYMWNIYGRTSKKKAILLTVKWTDLKKVLEKSEKK